MPGSGLVWFGERCPPPSAFTPKWPWVLIGDVCDMAGLSREPWGQTHPCEQVPPRC